MARISRVVVPEYPHHITQRGVRSMAIFQTDEDRRAYLQFLAEEAGRFDMEILAWCLMTMFILLQFPSVEIRWRELLEKRIAGIRG